MASFELRFKKTVAKDLQKIPNQHVKRILERINALSDNPRPPGCEKLSAQERYRLRQGAYRIIYEIREQQLIMLVVKIAHRGTVYQAK